MEGDFLHLDELQEEVTDSYSTQKDKSSLEDDGALLTQMVLFTRQRSLTVRG